MSEYERMQANYDRVAEKKRLKTVLESSEYTSLELENKRLREALEVLVMAKNEKETHGDNPVYQALKSNGWELANQALDQSIQTESADNLAPQGKTATHSSKEGGGE